MIHKLLFLVTLFLPLAGESKIIETSSIISVKDGSDGDFGPPGPNGSEGGCG